MPIETLSAAAELHARRARRGFEQFLKAKLMWHRLYRAASYARSSLWISPLLSLVAVLVLAPLIRALDAWLQWRLGDFGVEGAQALYQTVITLTLSFVVFTFGSLLVAIQIAGGQLTPRIIATALLRDNVVRASVGLFVFTLIFSVMALNRLGKSVPELVTTIIAVLGIACMAMFLFLIDYAARLLRPVSILARIGEDGLKVIEAVYPVPAPATPTPTEQLTAKLGVPARVVRHEGKSEIVLAVDVETLVHEAATAGGIIELIPQVGDFVARGDALFGLHGGATGVRDPTLLAAVAFGPERTLEQDPVFALRIMVDIALKALSPAINDPTTAVLALDQIHRFLRAVGKRSLRGEIIADAAGTPRMVYRTPNWEDFVAVACIEIRSCGANNVQIARRLRAMLENLVISLPEYRRPPLTAELERLDSALVKLYSIPGDIAFAREPDVQGLGGASGERTAHIA
jgi:uncharacterized membrane protein